MNFIDTEKASSALRDKAIDTKEKTILITNFENSEQKNDLTEPPNCNGFGRIRHFKMGDGLEWPKNPLPILPAIKALGLQRTEMLRAQVFQNAVCNWRCWYCFVDFKLLSGNKQYSTKLSCKQLLEFYLDQDNPPLVIDLTGGQPDITPEWIPWMMKELRELGIADKVYLWSDDNLSNDYFWRYLSSNDIELVASYKMYGRVCCFKGIDETSFFHNTGADPTLFWQQFKFWAELLRTGIDLYSYITLPAETNTDFMSKINIFMDRIQQVDENYLLRIVPLQIQKFSPVVTRMKNLHEDLLEGQKIAIKVWQDEMAKRFSQADLLKPITDTRNKFRQHE